MRKVLSLLFLVYLIPSSYGQVGINVPLPLQVFHVDGSKNNSIGIAPNIEQEKDDFVVTKEGNVGVGSYTPQAKIDVNGQVKIMDGSQGDNKILTSDSFGNMRWSTVPFIVPTIVGTFESSAQVAFSGTEDTRSYTYSRGYIILPKGRWIVNCGLTIHSTNNRWMHAVLSTVKTGRQQTGFTFLGPAKNNTSYASRVAGGSEFALLFGSSVIDVTADTVTIYVLIENVNIWTFSPSSWENYFYAIPVV
ncbi:hypothetical protein [Myroides sp. N17-2]|uniref:hypothetical protein n=1 Tax=Myroides sp. N17-2 TaxID=2030799 RepID=UPI000EFA7BD4|nr:hypothetical protein [Myroides sp. N17-2]